MKNTRTKRALAFFMSVIITLTTFASDASLITTYAAGTGDSLTASTTTDEGLKITKSAKVDGEDVTLTFTVDGADGKKIIQTTSETAVVFVMDISNSMESRLKTAKNAAKEFATGLLKNDKVSVGVVSYGTYAYEEQALSKNADDITKKINKISIEGNKDKKDRNLGGTNLQAGIYYAEDMLKKSAAAKKIIVVLSDGEPTFNYKVTGISKDGFKANDGNDVYPYTFDYTETENTGTQQTYKGKITYKCTVTDVKSQRCLWGIEYTVSYEDEFGKTGTKTVYGDSKYKKGYEFYKTKTKTLDSGDAAISEAKLAKDAGIDIYSIAYDVDENSSASSVMFNVANKGDASNKYYYEATSKEGTNVSNAISAVLKSIQTSIEEKVKGAIGTSLVDDLPSYMTFDIEDSVNSALISEKKVKMDENSFTWDLGDLGSENSKTVIVKAKLDIDKMIEAYAKENNTTEAIVRAKMAEGTIEFNLNELVTLSYKDKDGTSKENTDINVSGKAGVPKTNILTYPYTIKYTVDGKASDDYPLVTGYGYEGEEINVELYSTSEAISDTKEITRGNEALTPENGELSFDIKKDSNGAANVITVALHSAIHKVIFMVDGQKYNEQDVPYGEAADAPTDPEMTGYTFTGWDTLFSNITTDTTVNANFTINKYNVTFNVYNADGTLNKQSKQYNDVSYGEEVKVPVVTLPDETAKSSYTGSGWRLNDAPADVTGNDTITVTQNAEYKYTISEETRKYTVNYFFKAADGTEKQVGSFDKFYGDTLGEAPDYSSLKTPETDEYKYAYSAWYTYKDCEEVAYNPDDTVIGTTNVYVKETSSKKLYTVGFVFEDYDGKTNEIFDTYAYGEITPSYPETLYTRKQNNDQYKYSYTLDKLADKVTGDVTYYVIETRTVNEYEVTLKVCDDGKEFIIAFGTYKYGHELKDIKNYEVKGKEGYTAKDIKWAWDDTYIVTGAATLTTYIEYDINEYNVTFKYELFDADSNVLVSTRELDSIKVNHGKTLEDSYPDVTQTHDDDQYAYTLGDWDVDEKKEITGPTTVTIKETRVTNSYDVTFVVNYVEADGETPYAETETKTVSVKYGTAATAPNLPTPAELKEAQDKKYEYDYTVSGWNKDFTNITGKTTVTATVTREKIKYNVTFKIEGQVDFIATGVYGDVIDVPTIPQKDDDNIYTYKIKKDSWPEGSNYTITGDATFEASYTKNYIDYTITFVATNDFDINEDKQNITVGKKSDVHYDDMIVTTSEIVTDYEYRNWFKDDEKYDYELTDFADYYSVTGKNLIVYATWTRTPVNHTITYVIDDVSSNDTFAYGTKVTIKENPDKTGYDFKNWTWTKADGSSLEGAPDTMPEYDLVATASFEAKTYTVKVNYLEEGTENKVCEPNEVKVKFDTEYEITSPAVEHFTVKTNDAVKSGTFDSEALTKAADGVLTLNAYYTRDFYTVRFFDCGSETEPIETQTVVYGSDATAPLEFNVPDTIVNGSYAKVYWFDKWSKDFTNVSKDLDVKAEYAFEDFYIAPSVTNDTASTIVGTDISGNLLDNDNNTVTFDPTENSDKTADIKVNEDGTFEVKAKAAGTKTVTVPYTYSNSYSNDHGTWVLSYEGSESLEITVYEPSTLTLSNKTVKYDGKEQKLDFNAEGFKNVTYTYGNKTTSEMPEFIDADTYTVTVNAEYEAGGKTYAAAPVSATLTIQKRNVVLTSASDTKTYDSTALTNKNVTVSGDGFADGEGAEYTVTGSQTVKGESANTFTYELTNKTKASNYDISTNEGTLTVNAISDRIVVTIAENSGSYEYDGREHSVEGYTVKSISGNDLYKESDFSFTGDETHKIATGEAAGDYNLGIVASDFTNNNKNFENVTFIIEEGKLTITPFSQKVTVRISGDVNTVMYDGNAHNSSGYTVTGIDNEYLSENDIALAEGVEAKATLTDAGKQTMGLDAASFVNNNKNFSNVSFEVTDGYIEVTKRAIEIISKSGEKVYDSTPLEIKDVDLSGNDFAAQEGVSFDFTGSVTDVSENEPNNNTFTFTYNPGTKAENYDITVTYGTLTILPVRDTVEVTVRANSDTALYDGVAHTVGGYEYVGATNDLYTENCVEFTGADLTATNAGTYAYDLTDTDFNNASANFSNVHFIVEDGTLTINRRPVTVTANANLKVAGGEDPSLGVTVTNSIENVNAYAWRESGEAVGEYTIYITIDGTYPNYDITVEEGRFTIYASEENVPVPPVTPVTPVTPTPVTPVTPTPVVEEETVTTETTEAPINTSEEVIINNDATPKAGEIDIYDENVPKATASHCFIHWIILGITLVEALYTILRAMQNKRELDDETETANNN